jgi:hypothetical protein
MNATWPASGSAKVMFVIAQAGRRLPETVAHFENLIVLGVRHIFGQRQPLGVVRDDSGEILIHHAFETYAVAVERDGSRRRMELHHHSHHGEGTEG